MSRLQEGVDCQWVKSLPGVEYTDQNSNIACGAATICGTRESQQDAFAIRWINESTLCAMVCDGMGGMAGGEIASKKAIELMTRGIEQLTDGDWSVLDLFSIVTDVNEEIKEIKTEDGSLMKCGTTMALAIVRGKKFEWISIGDSSIYLYSASRLKRITNEHNYALMCDLLKDDANFTQNSEVRLDALVSYIGAPVLKYIDYNTVSLPLNDGDMILLCSDGITKLLSEREMEEILSKGESQLDFIARKMIEKATANVKKSQDNTTVVLLKYKE